MFGTGISPGFAELLAIVSATICDRVDKVTVNEAADTTFYDSPATESPVGFGQPIDHPDLQAMTAQGTAVFGEAVRLVADALGVELDDVRCEAEYAQTTADLDLGSWTIAGRLRRGRRRELEGIGRRQGRRRAQRPVAQGPDARARLEDRPGRLGDPGRRAADGDAQRRLPAAARLRGRDDRRLHGARAHHDGDARRSTPSPPSWPPRPASRRTTTCPWCCPAVSCRGIAVLPVADPGRGLEAGERAARRTPRSRRGRR